MPDIDMDTASHVTAEVARRWEALDPLLPHPGALAPGCGAELITTGPGGQPSAVASCDHWEGTPGSLELTWGAARRFQLTVHTAGTDIATGLDGLLSRWRDHLTGLPGTEDLDSSAVVTWPSRDIEGVTALQRHGLAPLAVIAARVTSRAQPDQSTLPRGLASAQIRQAGPGDLGPVVDLGLEAIRFDAYLGAVTKRAQTPQALRAEAAAALAEDEPRVWLAERDGEPAGMVWVQPPEAARWIAPMTSLAPAGYLMLMGVAANQRGQGSGTALAQHAHRQIAAAGAAVTLLHYALPSPLSAPFWNRQGYRPLWTVWETRPAITDRRSTSPA